MDKQLVSKLGENCTSQLPGLCPQDICMNIRYPIMEDNNSTLRRRHNPLQMASSQEEDMKRPSAQEKLLTTKQILSLTVAALFVLFSFHISTDSAHGLSVVDQSVATTRKVHDNGIESATEGAQENKFDCAIFWLRMPKTASTTIAQTFIRPLFREGNFTNIDLGPNSCITHVGGCAPFWQKQMSGKKGGRLKNSPQQLQPRGSGGIRGLESVPNQYVPPFGKKVVISDQQPGLINQRCFPSKENQKINRLTLCQEYDSVTSTLNFGFRPDRRRKRLPSVVQASFDAGPRITTHVGLDPSLFGWILPPNPMVFSTFRDPLDRIFSSFHYGIQFGGGRPGAVGKCDLPGVSKVSSQDRAKIWEEKVVKTREIATLQNDTVPYQELLRQYLTTCEVAVNNAYVQFLDPDTNDVNVAIRNLEDYVIVGLQTDMGETLSRWVNITKQSCSGHKHFGKMERVFADIFDGMTADGEVKKFRESKISLNEYGGAQRRRLSLVRRVVNIDETVKKDNIADMPASEISLVSPDINSLDSDLKEMITRYTSGDQLVWKRVLELYEIQRDWGRS